MKTTMFIEKSVLILCTVFIFSESAFVDTLSKCGISDGACHTNNLQRVVKESGKTGIPELDLPPFDPVVLKEISIPILNVVDLDLVDGVVKGLKNCVVNNFKVMIEKGHATMDITCDLTVKGHYKAFSNSPLVKSVLGGDSVRGDGNAKVKIEKLNIKLDLNFYVEERDGETYIKYREDKLGYKFDIGKMQFAADKLFVGDQDASATITNLLNQNWKLIVDSVGKQFMERAMERIKTFIFNFFDRVPAKYYILDDLSAYVKH